MTPPLDLRLVGARVLIEGALTDAPVTLAQGRIADHAAPEVDLSGYWLLPAIVDLHGDGFEHHIRPRPTAPFEPGRALLNLDAELAANGVGTAWLAQSWSWEGGSRSAASAQALMEAVGRRRADLSADIRVQVRFETHMTQDGPALLAAVDRHRVDFVVFNNHLPEAVTLADTKPDRFASWAGYNGHAPEALLAIVRHAQKQDPVVPAFLTDLAAGLAARGVRMGSHDDGDATTRAFFRGIGAPVCEFPTTFAAAQAAIAAGEPVLMGAPNVVRGGSQAGNIAAADLVAAGLCDALVSDYYYPALAQAAWALADAGTLPFGRAWGLVSQAPARIAGLTDRGRIAPGLRADLVVMNPESRRIEATIVAGRLAWLGGAVAGRFLAPKAPRAAAA